MRGRCRSPGPVASPRIILRIISRIISRIAFMSGAGGAPGCVEGGAGGLSAWANAGVTQNIRAQPVAKAGNRKIVIALLLINGGTRSSKQWKRRAGSAAQPRTIPNRGEGDGSAGSPGIAESDDRTGSSYQRSAAALPGNEVFLQPAHEQLDTIADQADDDDADHYRVGLQKILGDHD